MAKTEIKDLPEVTQDLQESKHTQSRHGPFELVLHQRLKQFLWAIFEDFHDGVFTVRVRKLRWNEVSGNEKVLLVIDGP